MYKAGFLHIDEDLVKLSPQQRNVYKYIRDHYDKVAFSTVEQLADQAGVSPATVVRTVDRIGYPNYQALKDDIIHIFLSTKEPTRHELEDSWVEPLEGNILVDIAKRNVSGIHSMLTPHLIDNFDNAVSVLSKSKKIKIMGQRSSRSAAIYFYLLLREFLPAVDLIGNYGTDGMYEELIDLSKEDSLFAISYGMPLYAKRTIDAAGFLFEKGIPVVLLTDSLKNPAVPFATSILLVPSIKYHYTLVPVMTVLDALIAQIGRNKIGPAKQRLRTLWSILSKSDITVSTAELQEEAEKRNFNEWSSK